MDSIRVNLYSGIWHPLCIGPKRYCTDDGSIALCLTATIRIRELLYDLSSDRCRNRHRFGKCWHAFRFSDPNMGEHHVDYSSTFTWSSTCTTEWLKLRVSPCFLSIRCRRFYPMLSDPHKQWDFMMKNPIILQTVSNTLWSVAPRPPQEAWVASDKIHLILRAVPCIITRNKILKHKLPEDTRKRFSA